MPVTRKKSFKQILIGDEFQKLNSQKAFDLIKLGVSEMLGTAILLGLGCMGTKDTTGGSVFHLNVVFSFSMAVATSVMIFGHVSGSHINPALSLVAVVMGKISLQKFLVYTVFQCIGAVLGYSITRSLFPAAYLDDKFCCTFPNPNVELSQAFTAELILTAIIGMVLSAAYDQRCLDKHDSLPLKFGFAVVALAVPGAQFAGCSVNPARSFGPALITGHWEHHWVYWLAPLSGAFIGSFIYRVLFYDNPESHEVDPSSYDVTETVKLQVVSGNANETSH
uniref:Aquaporin n=1 Tax=Cacopsylla melanoneura TaxID=428564 RepID=A0A8D9BDM7_9HEMI